ncbi:MAG: dehydrogenase, partial [Bacteroidales bacterium]|nr:dehydrogenase [Bacteroidales bacterium]
PLKHYAWSSPVAIYNEKNELFIFTGDTAGNVYLIDGKSGKIITTRYIGNNFESSPIVIDNHVVIGSRGREIYKLSIL